MSEEEITTAELFDIHDESPLGVYILEPGTTQEQRQDLSNQLFEEGIRISFMEKVRRVSIKWLLDTYGD